jgi:AcrR family transcriptional regulator
MDSRLDNVRSPEQLRRDEFNSRSPRERILAAALKLFVEQGYFNTNVPDLSRESKCSVGSIYHNFKNKEQVAAELYREGIGAFRQELERSLRNCKHVDEIVKQIVRSFLTFSEINLQLSKYLWLARHSEFMSGSIKHPTTVGFDRLGRTLTRAIKGGIRSGQIRPLDANIIWSILFGVPLAYVRDWFDGYNTDRPSKVADEIAEACWRALKA